MEIYKLEQEFEIYEIESKLKANPVIDILLLALGMFLAIISFVVLLHILLYVLIIIKGKPAS